jgi:GT2 family glycosyltransferase
MSDLPLVSIISINYNQARVTCELIESLKKVHYPKIEIIIVDNASSEDPSSIAAYPEVQLLRSNSNLGFSGGNNLGIRAAKGSYLLFLNNDTEVEPDFLEPLVTLMESNKAIGMVTPKIVYFGTNIIQYAGSHSINPFTGRGKKIGSMEVDNGQYNDVRETSLGHGAALMVSRKLIQSIGLMPELFFLYYEEHDWCEKAKRAGFKIYYSGVTKIYHKESMSVGKNSILKTYYMNRNRVVFMRRNVFGVKRLISLLFYFFISVPKNTIKFISKGEFDHLKALYKALAWNLTHFNVNQTEHFELTESIA